MTAGGTRSWVGVVSRAHVARGVAGGFAMLNHGKEAPLRRLRPGDGFVYYSPKTAIDGVPLKAFTAIGTVTGAAPCPVEVDDPGLSGAQLWRRDMAWVPGREVPLATIEDQLAFTKGNWGMMARRGLFEISGTDFATISLAMTG